MLENQSNLLLYPSSLDRIFNCPGSVFLPQEEIEPGKAAVRGSQLHEMIESGIRPEDEHAAAYFDWLPPYANLEMRVGPLSGPGWEMRGRVDALWFSAPGELTIADFKSGYFEVDPTSMPMLAYALLAYHMPGFKFVKVRLVIHQKGKVKDVILRTEDILPLKDKITERIASKELKEGQYCKYCPAQKSCPLKIRNEWAKFAEKMGKKWLVENSKQIISDLENAEAQLLVENPELFLCKTKSTWRWKKGIEVPTKVINMTVLQAKKAGIDTDGMTEEKQEENWVYNFSTSP